MVDMKKVVTLMRAQQVSILDMAEAAGIEEHEMHDIIWGKVSPSVYVFCKMAGRLGVGIEKIWTIQT